MRKFFFCLIFLPSLIFKNRKQKSRDENAQKEAHARWKEERMAMRFNRKLKWQRQCTTGNHVEYWIDVMMRWQKCDN